jgi:hypothetical protein
MPPDQPQEAAVQRQREDERGVVVHRNDFNDHFSNKFKLSKRKKNVVIMQPPSNTLC